MVRRGGFNQRESPDVIAMQETKYEVGDDSWVEEMLWVMIESSRSRGVERGLMENDKDKWCIFGYFNVIRSHEDRLNSQVNAKEIDNFNTFINNSQLVEILMGGRKFTRVSDDGLKFSKLDRFLVTEGFKSKWGNLAVVALDRKLSDHCPIVLKDLDVNFGLKSFRIFDIWLKEADIQEVVLRGWNKDVKSSTPDCRLRDKLKNVKSELKQWSKKRFGAIDTHINTYCREAMYWELEAESRNLDEVEMSNWMEASRLWLDKEREKISILRQKARVRWDVEGDENSKFFHSYVKRRNNKNSIRGLMVDGEWCEDPKKIKDETHRFYKLIFSKRDWLRPTFLNGRLPQLSAEDANLLEIPIEEKEIWEAVNSCGGDKAPGPDGFNFRFIKRFWEILKSELVNAVKWFWDTKEISRGCNSSFVALIPKSTDPIGLGEYRPISLIGCYYKIITKLLAERLKKVIGKLVGDVQNAFIGGRFILDDKWCTWIEACLKSSSMSVLVNCSPTAEFRLERGVRQGDPLSPFLFILAAEGLNAMVNDAVDKGVFKEIKVGTDNVVVSHLQYANDTIYFGEWDKENAKNLMCILKCFERVSGLKVNLNKSRLYGVGVNSDEVVNMARWMQCSVGDFPFTYLGLPIGECMRRESAWRVVVEKFRKRLCSLRAKNWALVGKWWWRFRLESGAYWVRVIKSIYGINGGLDENGVLRELGGSGVWRDIVKVSIGFSKKVGNVGDTSFWKDGWIGNVRLCDKFPRLCHLDRCKEARVIDRGEWSEGVWRWEMDWEREPRGRACGDLAVLMDLLHSVNRTCDCRDSWQWNRAEDGKFKVKDLSHMVDDLSLQVIGSSQEMVWNKLVPKKVNIFIWRALNGRIPVRVELDKRGVDLDSVLCPCCGD
ncbi:putative RNA-directed DNA polymerase [Tanacetum coccineum]